MLLTFRVSNFRSYRDEQEFSFVHGTEPFSLPLHTPGTLQQDGAPWPWFPNVGTVAGVFGPNASGKSNLIKALRFMRRAVVQSHRNWQSKKIPFEPFKLDLDYQDKPSLFEVTFFINNTRYQYGFRLSPARIESEWLYAYRTNRRQIWFEREADADDEYYFGKMLSGRNKVIADLTRSDTLFLSSAAANNHRQLDIVHHWISTHLRDVSPDDRSARVSYTRSMSDNRERWDQVTALMQFADLGICDARVREGVRSDADRDRLLRVLAAARDTGQPDNGSEAEAVKTLAQVRNILEFGHSSGGDSDPIYLPFADESLGTQAWFSLIGPVIRAIGTGDTLMVDELDASLHPQLTSEVLKIFWDPERNPKQAQLLFTTHDTSLLGRLLDGAELARDQVWFTEKARDGSSTLYPLTDFGPRRSENLERGYLQGRYGAVPYLDEKILERLISPTASTEGYDHSAPGSDSEAEQEDIEP